MQIVDSFKSRFLCSLFSIESAYLFIRSPVSSTLSDGNSCEWGKKRIVQHYCDGCIYLYVGNRQGVCYARSLGLCCTLMLAGVLLSVMLLAGIRNGGNGYNPLNVRRVPWRTLISGRYCPPVLY